MKKVWQITLVLVLLAGILPGCGTAGTTETETSAVPAAGVASQAGGGSEAVDSAALNESYKGALPVSSQLALGTFLLEGTENEVSSDQAQTLLPLWQVIGSGALESEAETNAVLKQIEGAMTSGQLAAIAAMQLTSEDMATWAQEQGVTLGGPGDGAGTFLPKGMTEEEMEAMRATAEASGMTRPDGAGGMGGGQLAALAGPLVEMLTELAKG